MTTAETTCPHCGFANRPDAAFCEGPTANNDVCGTYLGWHQASGTPPPAIPDVPPAPSATTATAPPPGPRTARTAVQVGLSLGAPAVEPGREVTCTIRVRNVGTIVDRFVLDVGGAAAGWSILDPVELSLYPGTEGTAALRLSPPRASEVPAGFAPIVVRATSASDSSVVAVGEAVVEIRPFLVIEASLVPRTSNGSTGALPRLVVANSGNRPVELAVHGTDPDDLLGVSVEPPVLRVLPGQSATAAVRLTARRAVPPGPAQPRPFTVRLEGPPGAEWSADGIFLQEPEPPRPPASAPLPPPPALAAPPATGQAHPAGSVPPRRTGGGVAGLIVLIVLLLVAIYFLLLAVWSVLQGYDELNLAMLLIIAGFLAAILVLAGLIRRNRRRRRTGG